MNTVISKIRNAGSVDAAIKKQIEEIDAIESMLYNYFENGVELPPLTGFAEINQLRGQLV